MGVGKLSTRMFILPGERVNISSRLAVRATLFATLLKIGYFYCHENFTIDGQWLPDRVVKFARWQHSAMGHEGDLPGTTS